MILITVLKFVLAVVFLGVVQKHAPEVRSRMPLGLPSLQDVRPGFFLEGPEVGKKLQLLSTEKPQQTWGWLGLSSFDPRMLLELPVLGLSSEPEIFIGFPVLNETCVLVSEVETRLIQADGQEFGLETGHPLQGPFTSSESPENQESFAKKENFPLSVRDSNDGGDEWQTFFILFLLAMSLTAVVSLLVRSKDQSEEQPEWLKEVIAKTSDEEDDREADLIRKTPEEENMIKEEKKEEEQDLPVDVEDVVKEEEKEKEEEQELPVDVDVVKEEEKEKEEEQELPVDVEEKKEEQQELLVDVKEKEEQQELPVDMEEEKEEEEENSSLSDVINKLLLGGYLQDEEEVDSPVKKGNDGTVYNRRNKVPKKKGKKNRRRKCGGQKEEEEETQPETKEEKNQLQPEEEKEEKEEEEEEEKTQQESKKETQPQMKAKKSVKGKGGRKWLRTAAVNIG